MLNRDEKPGSDLGQVNILASLSIIGVMILLVGVAAYFLQSSLQNALSSPSVADAPLEDETREQVEEFQKQAEKAETDRQESIGELPEPTHTSTMSAEGHRKAQAREAAVLVKEQAGKPIVPHPSHIQALPHFPPAPDGWRRQDFANGKQQGFAHFEMDLRMTTLDRQADGLDATMPHPATLMMMYEKERTTGLVDPEDSGFYKEAAFYLGPEGERVLIQLWQMYPSPSGLTETLLMASNIGGVAHDIQGRTFADHNRIAKRAHQGDTSAAPKAGDLRAVYAPGNVLRVQGTRPAKDLLALAGAIDFDGLGFAASTD